MELFLWSPPRMPLQLRMVLQKQEIILLRRRLMLRMPLRLRMVLQKQEIILLRRRLMLRLTFLCSHENQCFNRLNRRFIYCISVFISSTIRKGLFQEPDDFSALIFEFDHQMSIFHLTLLICEGHDDAYLSDGDILIFPDMIEYRHCATKPIYAPESFDVGRSLQADHLLMSFQMS